MPFESFNAYLTLKMLHLIAMVTWFAGIFYLPRLFVYHAMSEDDASKERFKVMERKLYRGIMVPSEIVTIICGLSLLTFTYSNAFLSMGWLHIKLTLIVALIGYHHYCGYIMKQFQADINNHSHKFYRVINEIPVLILVGVIYLAVFKPF